VDPQITEEMKSIITVLQTSDWQKRLKAIEDLTNFTKTHHAVIKGAPGKFVQIIDVFCKLLSDNNAKVQAQAQEQFRKVLLNQSLKQLIESNTTLVIGALNNNYASANPQIREAGDLLFTLLEGAVDANLLVQPIVAQVNVVTNKAKAQMIDRLSRKSWKR